MEPGPRRQAGPPWMPDSEQQLHALRPNASIASFGFRWLQGLDNVHMVLSGMSDMAQMADNVATFEHLDPSPPLRRRSSLLRRIR